MHLLLAPALPRLVLVQPDEIAVVPLVERRVIDDGEIVLAELAQDDLERVLRPLEQAGESHIEMGALGLQHGAGAMGLGHAFLGQVDVLPAGEHIEPVPLALAMAHEDQHVLQRGRLAAFAARIGLPALTGGLGRPWFRYG